MLDADERLDLTVREQFAQTALQALLEAQCYGEWDESRCGDIAEAAVGLADAVVRKLEGR